MISYRGIFAFFVGSLFLWLASNPETLGDEGIPLILRGVLILAGLAMVVVGIVVSRFVYRRYRLLQEADPTPAEVVIRVHEDSDSTTYSLEVRLTDGAWLVAAVGNKAVTVHPKDVPLAAQVWCDLKSGAPVAVAINGKHINTLPVPRRL